MTHKELVTVPREFHPHEARFFSLFIKMLPCHQKCIRGRLLNANETLVKLPLRLALNPGWLCAIPSVQKFGLPPTFFLTKRDKATLVI